MRRRVNYLVTALRYKRNKDSGSPAMTANVQHTHCADLLGRELSIAGRRVEFLDQSLVGRFECRLVLIGVSADEVDDLSVVVGGLLVVAACLVDHAQSIVTVVDHIDGR